MKKYTFEIVITIAILIVGSTLYYSNFEEIKQSLTRSMGQSMGESYNQSFNESFKSSFSKSCYASAKMTTRINLDREMTSAEMEKLKGACECILTAGEKEGAFDNNAFVVAKYFADNETMNYLITKYECSA